MLFLKCLCSCYTYNVFSMGYTTQTIKGISWLGSLRVVIRIVTFIKTLVLARILSPDQFGIFGIATLLLTLIEILTETGINIFLVQKKDDIDKYISTAWIVSIIRGLIIAAVIFLTAPFVADFFHSPDSYQLIILISLVPIIRGFINPSIIKLQKELLFHKEFYLRSFLLILETIASVSLIIILNSVVGLIYGMIISALLEMIISLMIVKPLPGFVFKKVFFREILNKGKWITASTIFNYFYQHGDDIAIGRLLNVTSLGLYDMAYRISMAPLSDFADVITRVVFPIYVKISGDKKRLQKAFLKTLLIVSVVVIPFGLILSLFAKEIITIALGEKWIDAVPALQVLGIFGAIRAISVFASTLFISIQKQNIMTLISLVGVLGLASTIIPFISNWGIVGAGFSALVGTSCTIPVIFYYTYKYLFKQS